MQDCEFLQESHLNLIQDLPLNNKEDQQQHMQMPSVKTMSTVQPQYGAVQPPLNLE